MAIKGIDIGNSNLKDSDLNIYPAKYSTSCGILGHDGDVLEFNGIKYYMGSGEEEINYNKTKKETYLILLLYVLAKSKDNYFKIVLGLPAAQYKANKDQLRNKILENKCCNVKINGKPKTIIIDDVIIFPEGVASFYGIPADVKKKNNIIIDVGGGTVNFSCFKNNKLDKSNTLGIGILEVFKKIRDQINATYTLNLDLADIYDIYDNGLTVDGEDVDVKNIIEDVLNEFLIKIFNELKFYPYRTSKVFLVGGGSKILKSVFEQKLRGFSLICGYIFTNAIGFKKVGDLKWKENE